MGHEVNSSCLASQITDEQRFKDSSSNSEVRRSLWLRRRWPPARSWLPWECRHAGHCTNCNPWDKKTKGVIMIHPENTNITTQFPVVRKQQLIGPYSMYPPYMWWGNNSSQNPPRLYPCDEKTSALYDPARPKHLPPHVFIVEFEQSPNTMSPMRSNPQ